MTAVLMGLWIAGSVWILQWQRRRDGELDRREGELEARRHEFELTRLGFEAFADALRSTSGVPRDAIEAFDAGYELGRQRNDELIDMAYQGGKLVEATREVMDR